MRVGGFVVTPIRSQSAVFAAPLTAAPAPTPAAAAAAAAAAPLARPIDVPVAEELTARDWWSFHVGHLRPARHLAPAALAQQIVAALDVGNRTDAGRLHRLFLSRAGTADGAACRELGLRYLCDGRADDAT